MGNNKIKEFISVLLLFILSTLSMGNTPSVFTFGTDPQLDGGISPIHILPIVAGSAAVGPTAPGKGRCGSAFGYSFGADAEESELLGPVPPCWNGTSDITLRINFTNTQGDPIQVGETLKFNYIYRTFEALGSALAGTAVTGTVTYTHSGPVVDCGAYYTTITLPATGGNQPYTYGNAISGFFNYEESTSTYSGEAIVSSWLFLVPTKQYCKLGG